MNQTLFLNTDKWYKVILVWELYRIPYNLLMVLSSFIGITILHVTIPLVYMVIGIVFNILYTALSFIDLGIKKRTSQDKSKKIFISYYVFCSVLVIGIPVAGLITMWIRT
jgi:hypothetical protein